MKVCWVNCLTAKYMQITVNPSNADLNPTCHLLALLAAHLILHVSRIRVNEKQPQNTNT